MDREKPKGLTTSESSPRPIQWTRAEDQFCSLPTRRRIHMPIQRLTLVVLAAFSLLSCDEKTPPTSPPVQYPEQIDSTILITPSESLFTDSRALIWNCRTERMYGCINEIIASFVSRAGSVVRVYFQGIYSDGPCFTAGGPATCHIDLGELPAGHYSVEFVSRTGTTKVDLLVEEDAYVIQSISGQSVSFDFPVLRRIPNGTIWGLIGYLSPLPPPVDEPFLDSLATLGAQPTNLAPGEYGAFRIDSTGTMQWPGINGFYHALPYVRSYGGPSEPLREMVKFFGKTQSDRSDITLYTWRGEVYRSWVLATEP